MYKFKQVYEEANGLAGSLCYYLVEDETLELGNYTSFSFNGDLLSLYVSNHSVQVSDTIGWSGWIDMSVSEREAHYSTLELDNITSALTYPDHILYEEGKAIPPLSYPLIPNKRKSKEVHTSLHEDSLAQEITVRKIC
jgi:hypothetical protein